MSNKTKTKMDKITKMEQVERCWETFEVLHVLSFRKSGTSIIRDALLLFDWESDNFGGKV